MAHNEFQSAFVQHESTTSMRASKRMTGNMRLMNISEAQADKGWMDPGRQGEDQDQSRSPIILCKFWTRGQRLHGSRTILEGLTCHPCPQIVVV